MKPVGQKILVILIALPIVLYIVFEIKNISYFFSNQRTPAKYILPDGFKGWVAIVQHKNCDPAPLQNEYQVFKISEYGLLCSSTQRKRGFSQDIVIYKSQPKKNLLQHPGTKMNFVWNDHKRKLSSGSDAFLFYVGYELTKKQDQNVSKELKELLERIENGPF